MGAGKLAIIMIFAIPLAAVIGGILLSIVKILKSGPSRADGELQAEETKLMQDIHQGFIKMEERVEALETLLLERDGKKDDGKKDGGKKRVKVDDGEPKKTGNG